MRRVIESFALVVCMAGVAACNGGSKVPSTLPALAHSSSSNYRVISTFPANVGTPVFGPLIALDGVLYGVSSVDARTTSGFFYSLTQSGEITALHAFPTHRTKYGNVSEIPESLALFNGTFYAITTVQTRTGAFVPALLRIDRHGSARVIRANLPALGELLTAANGKLYGVSLDGNGGVFSITPTGIYHTVYTFHGGSDGVGPGALLFAGGTLFGTTVLGGSHGAGTLFSLTLGGTKRTIYNFEGGAHSAHPTGGIVLLRGAFYGTTAGGGAYSCPVNASSGPPPTPVNCGTIYTLTLSGAERTLHNFNYTDGAFPSGLTSASGTLYGIAGGDVYGFSNGSSTIYSISTEGTYRVLHRFLGGSDASWGNPGAVLVNGSLFGTAAGGRYQNGLAFSYRLPNP